MGSRKQLLIELQVSLGLPKVDRTKTRQMVRAYFELYREKKRLLAMDMEAPTALPKALKGYEKAVDPNLIHAPYSFGSGGGWRGPAVTFDNDGEAYVERSEDHHRREFVTHAESKVNRLKPYQRDIIRTVYMGEDQMTDDDAFWKLYEAGWYVSRRYYDDEKAQAIQEIAESLRIARYEEGSV